MGEGTREVGEGGIVDVSASVCYCHVLAISSLEESQWPLMSRMASFVDILISVDVYMSILRREVRDIGAFLLIVQGTMAGEASSIHPWLLVPWYGVRDSGIPKLCCSS